MFIVCLVVAIAYGMQEDEGLNSEAVIIKPASAGSVFVLEHFLDGSWSKRGEISIKSFASPIKATITQQLTSSAADSIFKLATLGDLYQVRLSADGSGNGAVSSFTSACSFYESDLQDNIAVHFSPSFILIGIEMSNSISCKPGKTLKKKEKTLRSHVAVVTSISGPK